MRVAFIKNLIDAYIFLFCVVFILSAIALPVIGIIMVFYCKRSLLWLLLALLSPVFWSLFRTIYEGFEEKADKIVLSDSQN